MGTEGSFSKKETSGGSDVGVSQAETRRESKSRASVERNGDRKKGEFRGWPSGSIS